MRLLKCLVSLIVSSTKYALRCVMSGSHCDIAQYQYSSHGAIKQVTFNVVHFSDLSEAQQQMYSDASDTFCTVHPCPAE